MIEAQLKLEEDMVCRGQTLYYAAQEQMRTRGEEHATSAAKRMTGTLVLDTAASLEARIPTGPGRRAPYIKFLKQLDFKRAALIAVRTMLSMVVTNPKIQDVALAIGGRLEDDVMFTTFEREHGPYFQKIMETLKSRHAHSYRHQHKALRQGVTAKEMAWEQWPVVEKVNLGLCLIDAVCQNTDAFEIAAFKRQRKTSNHLQYSESAIEWITKHDEVASLLRPAAAPLIVPPRDWTSIWDGGYHSAHMIHKFPLVKVKDKEHRKQLAAHKEWDKTLQAVNHWQAQPWAVNKQVLAVMTEVYTKGLGVGLPQQDPIEKPPFPLPADFDKDTASEEEVAMFMRWKREATLAYTAENERRGKCIQFIRSIQMAREYSKYDKFYFTYQADFRGRFYCTSTGLTPQGNDTAKGLLSSGTRLPLGPRGGYWLRVQGANTFGVDKVSYDDRVRWVNENEPAILASARDPIGQREFWGNADSPWQFLAFCFEYLAYQQSGYSEEYESNLAVALDGTCNGLQHFSAMLRDAVGGSAVNLVPHDAPSDIYGIVANRVTTELESLRAGGCEDASKWLAVGVTRKCTKRPVMTLPYGSTRTSCREYIEDFLYEAETAADIFPTYRDKYLASVYLTPIVWEAMRKTLVAAMEAMAWLQDKARELGHNDTFPSWTTPSGFRAVQRTCEYDVEVIKTVLLGSLAVGRSTSRTEVAIGIPTCRVNKRRQANSIAPNFVHSCDAAHMVLTTLEFCVDGPKFLWLVHDSYGTHACHADYLHKAIRSQFYHMYSHDVLSKFAKDTGLTTDGMPAQGTLELASVLDAGYFFG